MPYGGYGGFVWKATIYKNKNVDVKAAKERIDAEPFNENEIAGYEYIFDDHDLWHLVLGEKIRLCLYKIDTVTLFEESGKKKKTMYEIWDQKECTIKGDGYFVAVWTLPSTSLTALLTSERIGDKLVVYIGIGGASFGSGRETEPLVSAIIDSMLGRNWFVRFLYGIYYGIARRIAKLQNNIAYMVGSIAFKSAFKTRSYWDYEKLDTPYNILATIGLWYTNVDSWSDGFMPALRDRINRIKYRILLRFFRTTTGIEKKAKEYVVNWMGYIGK